MGTGITIRQLAFSGPAISPAELSFDAGLNIIFGASNTGKSFTTKALAFMFGASSKLPATEQLNKYDSAWLGVTLPEGRDVTFFRSTKGGNFRLHEGLITSAEKGSGSILLGSSDSKRTDTMSHYLLNALGFAGKVIVKNASAEKDNLSIRLLAPYVIVSEGDIIAERSPVLYFGQYPSQTFEKNLFRFLLTGHDDAAAVTVLSKKTRNVTATAKIELVDELIAQIDEELSARESERREIREEVERIEILLQTMHEDLRNAQTLIDSLVTERRTLADTQRDLSARIIELDVTLQRFGRLDAVYTSDMARLEALEEGGFVLVAMANRDCPICGAPPDAQRHNHASDEIERSHRSAAAEVRKIRIEQRDLRQTMTSLEAEAQGLRSGTENLFRDIKNVEARLESARPLEASARTTYEQLSLSKAELDRLEDLFAQRDRLVVRRAQIENQPSKGKEDKLEVGIDGTIAYEFGETVRAVLEAWKFPNADKAQFDIKTSDITIGGKERSANGKGVRAILHAAFNVAVLMYCRDRSLPHPGFLVLDTPLLTYREPLNSRHRELSPDEAEIKQTSLATHFYAHLASLKETAQIIIIENSDPPGAIHSLARIETFTGHAGTGRSGLF